MNYYIQGSAARAEEIKAAFEKMGFVCTLPDCVFDNEKLIFLTSIGVVYSFYIYQPIYDIIKTHPDYKELELPKPHYDIKNLHAGMPVLVRADNVCRWDYSVFSRITGNEDWKFAVCNGVSFTQCIPFEGNEHLLGTTDMCPEEYINW